MGLITAASHAIGSKPDLAQDQSFVASQLEGVGSKTKKSHRRPSINHSFFRHLGH